MPTQFWDYDEVELEKIMNGVASRLGKFVDKTVGGALSAYVTSGFMNAQFDEEKNLCIRFFPGLDNCTPEEQEGFEFVMRLDNILDPDDDYGMPAYTAEGILETARQLEATAKRLREWVADKENADRIAPPEAPKGRPAKMKDRQKPR